MQRGNTDYNFLIGIDKPSAMSSHDVVNQIRNITNEGRVGHMGTLDPLATGVLLIGIGSATRLNNYLDSLDKEYEVDIAFGKSTNTYDAEGEVVEEFTVDEHLFDYEFANDYVNKLVGVQTQSPPPFSAIKIDGQPAYKAARRGNDVEIPKREIEIYSANLLEINNNSWKVKLHVSKGTYIRSIVNDIGNDLKCGCYVESLRRTCVGSVNLSNCYTLEEFVNVFKEYEYKVIDAAELLGFPIAHADEKMLKRIKHGNSLRNNSQWALFPGSKITVVDDSLLAIYRCENLHELVCECKFEGPIKLA